MLAAFADLVLARTCVGCAKSGSLICAACWRRLPPPQVISGAPPIAVGSGYDGLARSLVLSHKRSLVRALARPLADVLGRGIGVLPEPDEPVWLVPIPAHRAALRTRGQDTVATIARHAAQQRGWVLANRALSFQQDLGSLSGLNRNQRSDRMRDAFQAEDGRNRLCIVVDDVITSGATVRSAIHALRRAHWRIHGAAAVAGVLAQDRTMGGQRS